MPHPRPSRRRALRLAQTGIAAFALLPLAAGAVGFGKARVLSRVGQPLKVDVPLLGQLAGDQGDAACFRVAVPSHAGGDDLPWLPRARVEILGDAAPYLRITTTQAIPHPILMLGVRAGCGMEVGREFTLLLEAPPDHAAVAAPEDSTAPATVAVRRRPVEAQPPAAEGADTPRQDATLDAAPVKAAPSAPPARSRAAAAPRKPKRAKPHAPAAPAAEAPAAVPAPAAGDHLSVSGGSGYADGGDSGLRMATALDSLTGGAAISERERALLRQEQRLLAALDEQTSTQMMIEDKIRVLEATLAELRREAQPFEPAPTPAAPLTVPAAAPAPTPVARAETGWGEWLAGALAGLLVVGLVGMRRRRPATPAVPEGVIPPAQGAAPAPVEEAAPADAALDLDLTQPVPTDNVTPLLERTIVLPKPPLGEPPVAANDGASNEAEQDSVVELADIMLSFGRSLGAAQALSDFIAAHPKQGVKPWIKLLEVYRHAGMRTEFEELAPRLNRSFNVRVPAWEAFDDADGGDTLENYPHIMTRLNVGWDDPDALDYLQSLLRDNRNGQRLGFPLPVIGEILLLIAIQRQRQSATADTGASDDDSTEGGLRLVVN